ncbi:hypothetical protein ACFQGE_16655 [Halomicroarcula sp. GCM10025817]|uniref:hypothetical protein n=1 Tax=Haloarcula TaxID=2237 RepID=UPI0023E8858B|nr:hypothetical protein [Halomicroarcula sp. SYNS111]
MVPDSRPPETSSSSSESRPEPDGGTSLGFDQAALYRVIHTAVKDALLDVIGTLLLVGIALVLVLAGAQAVASSTSTLGSVAGFVFVVGGLYLAAATLELIPPVREWI